MDRTAPGQVCFANTFVAVDDPASRKVWCLDVLEQFLIADGRIRNERMKGSDNLPQVVRRDFRAHPNSDAFRTIDKQQGDSCRKNFRFLEGFVEVWAEINRVLVNIAENFHRDWCKAGFGVPHRCGCVVVNRAEVALPINQGIAHGPLLCHADHCVID
ncbi:hypothetical protein HRbin20_00909 [bacterium HR20]|nr:hypothetical protein HRbin20_00909 [bacterium HR20]